MVRRIDHALGWIVGKMADAVGAISVWLQRHG